MEKTINATEKQIKFMKQLGINYGNPTMQEARELIQNKLAEDEKDNIERGPVKPEEEAEKKAVYDKHKVIGYVKNADEIVKGKSHFEPKDDYEEDGFQIKSKQVRSNALNCAVELLKDDTEHSSILGLAKEFEKYIRFGE